MIKFDEESGQLHYASEVCEPGVKNRNDRIMPLEIGQFWERAEPIRKKPTCQAKPLDEWITANLGSLGFGGRTYMGRFVWPSREIQDVIFSGPATIVKWRDGTKTVVKRAESDTDDREKAILLAILEKWTGGKGPARRFLKKWTHAGLKGRERQMLRSLRRETKEETE